MKRIYILLVLISCSLLPLMSQTINGSDIQIKKQSVSVNNNMILVGMDITIPADMQISSDRMMTLTPIIQSEDGSANKTLPEVVV